MPLPNAFYSSGPPQFKPNDISDPLTRILLGPRQHENDTERVVRERDDREAIARSKQIDEWLDRERVQKERSRKKKQTSKVMLLGEFDYSYHPTMAHLSQQGNHNQASRQRTPENDS